MMNDGDLLERFTRIIGDKIEAGEDHSMVIDDALESGNLFQWCCRQEGLHWKQITWKPHAKSSDE
eukprot:2173501-Rhodomonas_salina.1